MNTLSQSDLDAALELQIEGAYLLMLAAPTDDQKGYYVKKMADLIAKRSPQQIFKMERERRLRRTT